MPDRRMRLQKYLAERGVASRRGAEEMIRAGRVTVNGRKAEIGMTVDAQDDLVAVDGKNLEQSRDKLAYLLLHKPRGYVTTMNDPHAARTVAELVADFPARLFPVGRLDKDSEGLLLMTNDGALANELMHPGSHVAKVYRVTLRGALTDAQQDKLSSGMVLDGRPTQPITLRVLEAQPGRTVVQMTLREGRNRQIRRMCEALGLEVLRLKRTAIGPLKLGMLPAGQWKQLTADEVKRLKGRQG